MRVKSLPKQFAGKGQVKGFIFTQVKQSDKAYIYQVNTGCSIYYEVFKKKVKTNSICHCFPTAKAFGKWAWTHMSIDKAELKFRILTQ